MTVTAAHIDDLTRILRQGTCGVVLYNQRGASESTLDSSYDRRKNAGGSVGSITPSSVPPSRCVTRSLSLCLLLNLTADGRSASTFEYQDFRLRRLCSLKRPEVWGMNEPSKRATRVRSVGSVKVSKICRLSLLVRL